MRNAVLTALADFKGQRFDYQNCDCCRFCECILQKLTGAPQRLIPFSYRNKSEADLIIDHHGGLAATVSSVLGEALPLINLTAGAVVYWRSLGFDGLGILLDLDSFAALHEDDGRIAVLPTRIVRSGWQPWAA